MKPLGLSLRWLTVSCFEIKLAGAVLVTDPFITDSQGTLLQADDVTGADYILLSHTHWDHILDIPVLMKRFDARLLLGSLSALPMARWLNVNACRIYPMDPNLELDFGCFRVKALYGRHTDLGGPFVDLTERMLGNPLITQDAAMRELQWWGLMEYRNYLITTSQGTRILIWGNNATVEQTNMLRGINPDIALLQYSRQDTQEIADFAAAIGAKMVIPHHMDLKRKPGDYEPRIKLLQEALSRLSPESAVICPEHGKWYHF